MTTYRTASIDDVVGMAHLRDASGWRGGAEAETVRRYLAGEHHPQHALAARVAFLAEAAGETVGYIAGHLTTRFECEGELQWFLIAPAQRGGDAAACLLDALAKWFREQGATRVCVNVAPDNGRARQFYARHGAMELSDHWMVWPDIEAARLPRVVDAGPLNSRRDR